ncbi:MAG TPA: alpha/beta fold hydrolase [Deltaproteobacteria bacterium]|nr:alpha/beta fold hydrolase [Deltaproteobacteria bacterium]
MISGRRFVFAVFFLCIVWAGGCASVQDRLFVAAVATERSLAGMHESSVAVGGRGISYLKREGPGETIVLLHGFGADKDNWPRFVRNLPRDYRVVAFDLPGHGSSFRDWEETYTISFMADTLGQAFDALKLERFHLVGNSMGGWVGTIYTSRNPDRVMTLALCDSAGTESPVPSDRQKALEQGRNVLVPETEEEFHELLGYAFHDKPFIPWPIGSVLARRAVQDAPFKRKIFADVNGARRDVREVLPEVNLPVLILWGAHDRITHVSAAQVFERYLPKSETVIMQECGHMPMIEKPRETAGRYVDFLRRHSTGTP